MKIVTIDPGVSTGFTVSEYEGGVPYVEWFGQPREDTLAATARFLIEEVLPGADVIVLEQFDLRPSNKFLADLSPVEMNAIIQYWNTYVNPTPARLVYVTPAQHKALVSNETLKRYGWYVAPKQVQQKDANDVRDAFRLLVFYLVEKEKDTEFTEVGWPRYS